MRSRLHKQGLTMESSHQLLASVRQLLNNLDPYIGRYLEPLPEEFDYIELHLSRAPEKDAFTHIRALDEGVRELAEYGIKYAKNNHVRLNEILREIHIRVSVLLYLVGALDRSDQKASRHPVDTSRPTPTPVPENSIEGQFLQALREISLPRAIDIPMPTPMILYVKDGDPLAIQQAMIDLAEEYGEAEYFPPLKGSFFQRFRIWTRSQSAQELSDAMRVAAQLPLQQQQANNNVVHAEAASKLIAALDNTDTACGLVGSMLVIKFNGVLNFRTLTNREIIYLTKHPGLIRDPASMQVALEALPIGDDELCEGCRGES
ncbi:hypothetical protein ACBJ59_56915 [Nonomuraea sp. MTCD27]|uniref:hypothetical protein n=1 Tax=Nonomuraea sp. MTCD27 TaxID=1676747 RepID=UPI0035BFC5EF